MMLNKLALSLIITLPVANIACDPAQEISMNTDPASRSQGWVRSHLRDPRGCGCDLQRRAAEHQG